MEVKTVSKLGWQLNTYTLEKGESIPDPNSTNRRIRGPIVVEIRIAPDGGQLVSFPDQAED